MFTSASYENRNRTNYYKIIYISKSTSYELKKNGTNYIRSYNYTAYNHSQTSLKDHMYYAKTQVK